MNGRKARAIRQAVRDAAEGLIVPDELSGEQTVKPRGQIARLHGGGGGTVISPMRRRLRQQLKSELAGVPPKLRGKFVEGLGEGIRKGLEDIRRAVE